MMLLLMQYTGVGLGMVYATILAVAPERVVTALWISVVSCAILGTWAIFFGAYGVVISQYFYVVINLVGIRKWTIHKKENANGSA